MANTIINVPCPGTAMLLEFGGNYSEMCYFFPPPTLASLAFLFNLPELSHKKGEGVGERLATEASRGKRHKLENKGPSVPLQILLACRRTTAEQSQELFNNNLPA